MIIVNSVSIRNINLKQQSVKLNMTSMIDVVFLLLAFFVITYKTPEVEGDFEIRMPAQVQSNQLPDLDELSPVSIRLTADASGNLNGIWFGSNSLGVDMQKLRQTVFDYIKNEDINFQTAINGTQTPSFNQDLEIELDWEENLRYRFVMEAITAVTGYLNNENQVIKLVEKIKFASPKSE